jgi:signal transduction histidine kinase
MGEGQVRTIAIRVAALPAPAVHALFALLLALAALVGRNTNLESTGLALVWPAAGVGFLWALWARHRSHGIGIALGGIPPIIASVNMITGLDPLIALAVAVGSVVQTVIAVVLFRRLVPTVTVRAVNEYFHLGLVALVACSVGAVVIVLGASLAGDARPLGFFVPWLVRHGVSLLAIGALGIVAGRSISARRENETRPALTTARRTEVVLLGVVSVVVYVLTFGSASVLPLAYATIPVHMWAGLRLRAGLAMLHGLSCGALLVVFTLQGRGPFQNLSPDIGAYVAQSFMLVAFSVSAVLALSMDERRRLIARLYRATEEAAAAANLRDLVIGKMNDGVLVMGADRQLVFQNAASERWLGPPTADQGEEWRRDHDMTKEDGTPLGDEENPLLLAHQGVSTERMGVNLVHRSGEVIHLSVDAVPLPDGRGVLVVMRDVTSEQLHQRDLSRFASVVAHDLLTPLTVFDGWLEMLEDPDQSADERQASIERLKQASRRMRFLIRNLLAYSLAKEEKLTARRIDVEGLARGIVDVRTTLPGAQLPDVRFVVEAPHPVYADERLFLQLLENLIGNALKYGRQDGTAEVRIATAVDGADGRTLLSVEDNGIGVPEGDRERVFDEFHRSENGLRQASGTGLGLAICKRIVESHGGTITVTERAGGGAAFVAALPGTPDQLPEGIPLLAERDGRVDAPGAAVRS